ncbi:hypothetical protein [Paraburkholderia sp. PGU19]|uniref:hypothetical protein n=1 Tax=Paraburkholderia sp. PGU19 TaxID=2735434 RepID=UPI0015DB63D2|nr:hypothetical protein [Paraburkholderia sp. PGU19]
MGSVITLAALEVQKIATLEFSLAITHVRASGDGDHLFDAIDVDRFLQFADPVICRATWIALIEITTPVTLSRIAETSVRVTGVTRHSRLRIETICGGAPRSFATPRPRSPVSFLRGIVGIRRGTKIQMKGILWSSPIDVASRQPILVVFEVLTLRLYP